MQLSDIRALVQTELTAIDALLGQTEPAQVNLVNQLTAHVTDAGGKRLRPTVLILTAKALGYTGDDHINLATAIELVHTATLLHDDVVDGSTLRRGKKTANELWGNAASVLVGDFLYSRAFDLMISLGHVPVMQAVARSTHLIAEGEIMQLMHRRNLKMRVQDYLNIIERKTGQLFEVAAHLGMLLAAPEQAQAAKDYGMNLGMAFQVIDDMLDYQGQPDQIGKNVGDDLNDGSLTLPLLYILQNGAPEQSALVEQAVQVGNTIAIEPLQQAINSSGAVEYAQQLAQDYIQKAKTALNTFPDNVYTQALHSIADFAIARQH